MTATSTKKTHAEMASELVRSQPHDIARAEIVKDARSEPKYRTGQETKLVAPTGVESDDADTDE